MICAATLMINLTAFAWNDNDYKVLASAERVCRTQYSPQSPCVSKFIKQGEQDYRVLCGQAVLKGGLDVTFEHTTTTEG
jgi:hypothetical protein